MNFWDVSEKATILRNIRDKFAGDICFVDLTEIKNSDDYICGINSIVYDDTGKEHVVKHEGVATHSGDRGMKYYADKIIEFIE